MNQNIQRSNFIIGSILMLVFLAILIGYTNSRIIAKYPITKDAKEYTTAAFNLKSKGMISNDGVMPSMFREPLTIVILAMHMRWMTDIPNQIDNIEQLTNSPYYVKQINKVNLLYIVAAFIAIWLLTYTLTKSHLYSAIAIYCSWATFYIESWYLYRPLTEYAASVFLLWIAYLGLLLSRQTALQMRLVIGLILGLTIGLLALTKAVAFYVAIVFVPLYAASLFIFKKWDMKNTVFIAGVVFLGLTIVVSPWIYRNSKLGSGASIAGRGGSVLLGRSKLNETIAKDVVGGFYVFSPPLIQRAWFEKKLGFDPHSLSAEGKYASLNRNVAFQKNPHKTAHKKFNLEPKKEQQSYSNGLNKIIQNLMPHLQTTAVMAWRGIWSFDGGNHLVPGGKTTSSIVMNLLSFMAFVMFPFIALINKKTDWFLISLFPAGFFWIYAGFSHFIPRYSAPLIPISILMLLMLIQTSLHAASNWLNLSRNKNNGA